MTPCSYTSPWQPQLRPLAGRCSSRPSTWPGSCTCRSPSGTPCTGRPGPRGDGDTGDGGGDDDIAPCATNEYTAPCDSDDDTAPFDSDDGIAPSDSDDDLYSFGSDDDIAKGDSDDNIAPSDYEIAPEVDDAIVIALTRRGAMATRSRAVFMMVVLGMFPWPKCTSKWCLLPASPALYLWRVH